MNKDQQNNKDRSEFWKTQRERPNYQAKPKEEPPSQAGHMHAGKGKPAEADPRLGKVGVAAVVVIDGW